MNSPLKQKLAVLGGALLLLLAVPATSPADAADEEKATAVLLTDVIEQQVKLAENQVKMDERIAQIAEEVRQARLFVARGGGKK